MMAEYALMVCCGCLAMLYHDVRDVLRLAILGTWILMFVGLASSVNRVEQHVEDSDKR